MPPRISEREKAAVRQSFARLDASKAVWDGVKGERRVYQDALRNVFPQVMPGLDDEDGQGQQVNVGHTSRVVAFCKSKFDVSPEIRISGMRDEDMKTNGMNEHILSRVTEKGGLPRAGRKAIDDMMSLGVWGVWFGVDSFAVDPARLAGLSTDPAELVALAAQGQDVHPLPGMDHAQTSQLAQDMYVQQTWTATEAQKQNLLRLAMEAEVALQNEKDEPARFTPYNFWYQSVQIGHGLFIDSTVFRMEDCRRMWRRIVFTVDQFKAWEPFKGAARKQCRPQSLSDMDGGKRPEVCSFDYNADATNAQDINLCYVVWEEWNLDEVAVHYLCEGWEGYLEVDSTYPFLDENGRPALDHFFPFWWVTPYQHNIPDATQPLGVPPIAYMFPQQMEVIKYRSAAMNTSKQAADQYLVSSRLDDDTKENLRRGVPGAMHEVPEDMMDSGKRAIIERVEMGMNPQIFDVAGDRAERDLFAMASVNAGNITGEPAAETVGQEEMLMRGGGAIQGDIMALVAEAYGGIVRDTATVIRLLFTPQHVAQYVGMRYITPKVDEKGNEIEPAPFAQWKADSLDGVNITASFATKGHGDDPIAIKQLMDLWVATLNWTDSLGMRVRDPAPIFDLLTKRMGIGIVPAYQASINELRAKVLEQMMTANGGVGPEGPQGGEGDSTGRRKDLGAGDRGPANVPGQQERGRAPAGTGTQSNAATRVQK